jgi:sec-independent protein translocase protein TatA
MPSGPEWIIVLVIVLLIFGGSQLPKLAKNLGKAQKEFKDGLAEGQAAPSQPPSSTTSAVTPDDESK